MSFKKVFLSIALCVPLTSISAQQYVKDEPPANMRAWQFLRSRHYTASCVMADGKKRVIRYATRSEYKDPATLRKGIVVWGHSSLIEYAPLLFGWEDESGEVRIALRRERKIGGWMTGYYTFILKPIWKKDLQASDCVFEGVKITLLLHVYGKDHNQYSRVFPTRAVSK